MSQSVLLGKDSGPHSHIRRPSFFYDSAPGKFYENPDLRFEVNGSEILRTKNIV